MADPQFEQFREVFERLPQHIKAPTYCYRLAHDILLDNVSSEDIVDDSPGLPDEQLEVDQLTNGHLKLIKRDSIHFSSPLCWKETNWTDNSCKEILPTLRWVTSTDQLPLMSSSSSSSSGQPATMASSGQSLNTRKRRRLPEIPKEKPIGSSIVFKTQALSLAEEISLAENLNKSPVIQSPRQSNKNGVSSPKHSKHQHESPKKFFTNSPRFKEEDWSPEEKILNTDIDSGNSTGYSPDGAKSFSPALISGFPISPASSSGVSTTTTATLESCLESHRGLHKFIPRHDDEVEIEIGDPLYVHKEADDLWCEGTNLRTGKSGIFPSAYVTDVEYADFDPENVNVKKERFLLNFLGSVEVLGNKGNDVLCQAIRKINGTGPGPTINDCSIRPHACVLEVSDQGLRMVDKSKPSVNDVPCHDYFFFLKNISFCGFHPNDYRYFGFITKHPTKQRFACHVFIGDESTRPVAESVGRAFQRFYEKFIETAYPIEDIYLE